MKDKEILKVEFKESLSDSSIKLIKRILKESLNYEVKIKRC